MRFKPDINALRGVAVALVVLFHFQTPFVQGGFVGVDVFFVISGYLMTAIIVGRLEAERFKLFDFYLSRFARIVPALAVLCAAGLVFGWFYLDPHGYKILAEHAGASVTFISNFVYWREAGYFDSSSQTKWFLHTWSLSAEWQFYLIYPVLLMLAVRLLGRGRTMFRSVLWLMGGVSFVLALVAARHYPEANFFLLPTRVWEMVTGGLVLLYGDSIKLSSLQARSLQTVGLAAIVFSGLYFTSADDWPGWRTLVPVLGAAAVIFADRHTWFTRFAPLQRIGLWSYSIYLWHWPLVVLTHYLDLPTHNATVIVGGLLTSIAMGFVSYELIERRAAGLREKFGFRGLATLAVGTACVVMSCAAVTYGKGFESRLPAQVQQVSAESTDVDPRRTECLTNSVYRMNDGKDDIGCRYGTEPEVGAIVWGDSHGNAVISSIAQSAAENDRSVMFFGTSGCPPFAGASRFGKHQEEPCRSFAKQVMQQIDQFPRSVPLVMVARFSAYVEGKTVNDDPTILIGFNGQRPLADIVARRTHYAQFLTQDLCSLAKTRKVFVLLPIPEMNQDVPDYLAKSMILDRHPADVSISRASYDTRNQVASGAIEAAASQCGVTLLDPTQYLCRNGRCMGSDGLMPLYIDGDHLSQRGSERLLPLFRTVFTAG